MAKMIREGDLTVGYPLLNSLAGEGRRVLEVGCGTGWLSNSLSYRSHAVVAGIDFNPVAIEFAQATAALLEAPTSFAVADLFRYEPDHPFDTVVSIGVLHHTENCLAALEHVFSFVRPGGHAYIGLYHAFGRRPFLDHFTSMRKSGASEEQQFARFRKLFGKQRMDETHLLSWFRDQVLHPHETQHTLAEVMPLLEAANMELSATSLNYFAPIDDIDRIIATEAAWESVASERLHDDIYFPGFFIFVARREDR